MHRRWHVPGSGPGPQPSYSFDSNNHLTPTNCTSGPGNFCYDAAGNLEYDGLGGNWAHDGEGRVFEYEGSSETATYTHDAAGQRVERTVSGATYDYVFDNQGKENTQGTAGFAGWNWSELYLGGMHMSTYADGSTYFSHADHLGSERMETDPTGNTNSSAQTNLPFGEWTSTGFQSNLGFTGDLHDDGGVFHTPFRQLSQTQGRWMAPDPAGLAAVNPRNPQTWNRYAYVGNNPTTYNDPSGLVDINPGMLYAMTGGAAYESWASTFIAELLSAGAVGICPNNNCTNVTITTNGYVGQLGYASNPDPQNPDIFQCDGSLSNANCYPTHWVSTELGNAGDGLPASMICVYIGSACDVPLNGAVFQGHQQLWKSASSTVNDLGAATAIVSSPVVAAGTGITVTQAIVTTLIGSLLGELLDYSFGGQPPEEHNPNWPPEPGCNPCDPEPPGIVAP